MVFTILPVAHIRSRSDRNYCRRKTDTRAPGDGRRRDSQPSPSPNRPATHPGRSARPSGPAAAVRRFGVTKTVAFREASDEVKHAVTIRLFENVGAPQGMLVRILEVEAGPAFRAPAHAIVGLQIL